MTHELIFAIFSMSAKGIVKKLKTLFSRGKENYVKSESLRIELKLLKISLAKKNTKHTKGVYNKMQ